DTGTEIPEGNSPLIEVADAEALVDEILTEGNEITVVNFWATWCGPCRIEFPELMAYDAEMEGTGVEVRFVSVDDEEVLPLVRTFLDEQGLTERSFISVGNTMLAGQFDPRWGISLPTTLILDADGIVRGGHQQMISKDQLEDLVAGVRDGSIDATTQL
ncbi:MAG: TlpA disulfide reductase family protein, partial [Bacteroidota bacterium]